MSVAAPTLPAKTPATGGDAFFRALCVAAGAFVVLIAAALVAVLVEGSGRFASLSAIGDLFVGCGPLFGLLTADDWNPDRNEFGALLFLYGSVVTSAIGMAVAVPLGVGAAAYLSEAAPPRVRRACAFLLELLAAVPSVVFGFWAKDFLARYGVGPAFGLFGIPTASGQGIAAAGLVLAVMVLPYVTAVSYDVFQAVPRSQREGSLSLGATRWQTIWRVVLPYARPGVIAACFLALGRAVGETMAVTMVIGGGQHLDFSPAATGDTIPSAIAQQLPEASNPASPHRQALVALGLLLMAVTVLVNVAARSLIRWASRPRTGGRRGPAAVGEGLAPPPPESPEALASARRRAHVVDRLMTAVLAGCQLATIVPLFLILGYIGYRGAAGVNWDFFVRLPNDLSGHRGLAHALVGSVTLVGLASAFAVPVGVMAAVFLSEFRTHPLARPVRFVTDILGGVPSIVIGIFGYALLVYPFWTNARWGFSAWAGAFALGVIMLPVVIRASEEALRLVPGSLREASYALGASRRQTVLSVLLPAALPAVITGVFLAVGRIAGETAPLILTARGAQYFARSASDPTPFLPFYVYEYSKMPDGSPEVQMAWAAALVLVAVIMALNVGIRLAAGQRVVAASRAD